MTQTETTAKPSQESFSELLDQSFQEMTSIEGSVVSGTVISIEKDMILIDVGRKLYLEDTTKHSTTETIKYNLAFNQSAISN